MATRTNEDPAGQRVNRNKAARKAIIRLNAAERAVKAVFRSIPRERRRKARIQNQEQTTVYDYQLSPEQQESLQVQIDQIIDRELGTQTDTMPFDWFWREDVELAYRQGALEETRDFNQAVSAAVAAGALSTVIQPEPIAPEQVLLDDSFREGVRREQVAAYRSMKTMSSRVAGQVLNRINAGVRAGETPTVIANNIGERFSVAKTSARRIADTEIQKSHNNAKLDATRILGMRTGLRAGVIHISALLPTTRDHHAARHGNAYTVEDQLQWWDMGANRINCKCTTRSILIDQQGKVINKDIQEKIESRQG